MSDIRKVAVIGAGTMGAGIAAQVANAGIAVELLDIVPKGGGDRNAIAAGALARAAKADPAPFMEPAAIKRVRPGNIEDHLDRLADADWIVEAVVENPDIKRALYAKIEAKRKPGSVVSSNTSTIPLAALTNGLPARFAQDFMITHFFNPPRYMRLLEIVAGPQTNPAAVAAIRSFADLKLGKRVVDARDTPGFIANRVGTLWLVAGVIEALDVGVTVEEADAVIGKPFGIPSTGVFGLIDLVGLDLMPHVSASLKSTLPAGDAFHALAREVPLLTRMIGEGLTGRKGKGGFYRVTKSESGRVKEAIDLASGAYRATIRPRLGSVEAGGTGGPRALMAHEDRGGRYGWRVMSQTLAYAATVAPEIADDIQAVDEAMRLGYAWEQGPFEILDRIGPAWFADRLAAEGRPVPELLKKVGQGTFYRVEGGRLQQFTATGYRDVVRPPGVVLLADIKRAAKPLARNGSASLWEVGDGVVCLEFHSRMNALDTDTIAMTRKAIEIIPGHYKGLVIYNEGQNFSVGANIGLVAFAANVGVWTELDAMVKAGQDTLRDLKRAPFPVVAAPSGMALGGGCEFLLHADAIQAHAETYAGLVEVGVGLIPGWGGCKETLWRWINAKGVPRGPIPAMAQAFEHIAMAKVSKSAMQARDMNILRPGDGVTMNRDRLLADARAKVLDLAKGYVPPGEPLFALPGKTGYLALYMAVEVMRLAGKITPHDLVVAKTLARVVSGADTDMTAVLRESELLDIERAGFMKLVREKATMARLEHMLETGRPLRN